MKVLVINCGSSSLKYQLFNMENEMVLAKGLVERIGIEGSNLTIKAHGEKHEINKEMKDHKDAIKLVLDILVDPKFNILKNLSEISAVGHRVVHGGEKYSDSTLITKEALKSIEDCNKLAPLHNPANLIGIKACEELMPNVPMVAVFDTAFHSTLPAYAYTYALPYEYYEKYGVRKYGFHGTSHKYVSQKAAEFMGKDIKELKIITCHLGNGASVAAVKDGKSVDTSMGFTPLEGVIMGTRCGNIDPAILPYIMNETGIDIKEMDTILNKKSGVLGVSEISSDFRDIEVAAKKGNKRAILTFDMYAYKVKNFIGAYAAAMGGVDCVVFTAGLGENDAHARKHICENLEFMGIEIDQDKNSTMGDIREISKDNSKVKVLVIPTDEELMIAKDTVKIVENI